MDCSTRVVSSCSISRARRLADYFACELIVPSYPSAIQQARIAYAIPFHTSSAKKPTLDQIPLSPLQAKAFSRCRSFSQNQEGIFRGYAAWGIYPVMVLHILQ